MRQLQKKLNSFITLLARKLFYSLNSFNHCQQPLMRGHEHGNTEKKNTETKTP
uniref:Uncharacterized protein n=1 Tax=Rhizophora mucronata TaxID=61149 RepID=A0A2P2KE65_RHIMU